MFGTRERVSSQDVQFMNINFKSTSNFYSCLKKLSMKVNLHHYHDAQRQDSVILGDLGLNPVVISSAFEIYWKNK